MLFFRRRKRRKLQVECPYKLEPQPFDRLYIPKAVHLQLVHYRTVEDSGWVVILGRKVGRN